MYVLSLCALVCNSIVSTYRISVSRYSFVHRSMHDHPHKPADGTVFVLWFIWIWSINNEIHNNNSINNNTACGQRPIKQEQWTTDTTKESSARTSVNLNKTSIKSIILAFNVPWLNSIASHSFQPKGIHHFMSSSAHSHNHFYDLFMKPPCSSSSSCHSNIHRQRISSLKDIMLKVKCYKSFRFVIVIHWAKQFGFWSVGFSVFRGGEKSNFNI